MGLRYNGIEFLEDLTTMKSRPAFISILELLCTFDFQYWQRRVFSSSLIGIVPSSLPSDDPEESTMTDFDAFPLIF